ncbi:hypothetical protein LSH36_883g00037 [Paralvinella palmiformis]|uniref:Uncharacterized protein n=1 Tax=Paralvinella palmiformis TaxID=53620 RepID=A0AAD9MT04_9ANNE|nr:hypothetical protein LSH36_883g00037 [Paralvinella palmiformis]
MSSSRKSTLRSLQSIIRLLHSACRAVVPGRAFLCRLITFTHRLTKPHHHIRLNLEARANLAVWKFSWPHTIDEHLCHHGGRLTHPHFISSWIHQPVWNMGEWSPPWKLFFIAFLEVSQIVSSLFDRASSFANTSIVWHTDNMSIVDIINSQSSKDSLVMHLVRRLVVVILFNNILFHTLHVPSVKNTIPGLLSDRFTVGPRCSSWPGCAATRFPAELSNTSRKGHCRAIKYFYTFVKSKHPHATMFPTANQYVMGYITHSCNRRLGSSTIASQLSAISYLYKLSEKEDDVKSSPLRTKNTLAKTKQLQVVY